MCLSEGGDSRGVGTILNVCGRGNSEVGSIARHLFHSIAR